EVMVPIEEPKLKDRIVHEVLGISLRDNQKARQIFGDGSFAIVEPEEGEELIRSQVEFYRRAKEAASKTRRNLNQDRPYIFRPGRIRPGADREVKESINPGARGEADDGAHPSAWTMEALRGARRSVRMD